MPIANFLIKKILKAHRDLNHYNEDEIDMMRYSLEVLLWETEKFVYMVIIFALLGYWWQFLACVVVVMTIRPMAGGYHARTAWRCFWWTLFGFVLAILVLPLITLNSTYIVLIGVFSLVVTCIAAPLRSEQMERIANKDKDWLKKTIAAIVTVIWFVVLFVYQEHFLAASAIWIIFLQNVQLIIPWVSKKIRG